MRIALIALSFVVTLPVSAQDSLHDWPHFLGPEANGKTTLTDADFNWGDAGPEAVWKLEIGTGYGGVAGNVQQVLSALESPRGPARGRP